MTFPCVRDEISKSILPTGPAHPRHPRGSGKSRTPQDGRGAARRLPSPDRRASLCKGHGAVSCPHSLLHPRLDPAGPGWTRRSRTHRAPLQGLPTPACACAAAAAGTVGTPPSQVGKLRTGCGASRRPCALVCDASHPFSGARQTAGGHRALCQACPRPQK